MSTTAEVIFGSEARFEFQEVSMKLNLGHVSRGVPLKEVLACKHVSLQDVHVADLKEEGQKSSYVDRYERATAVQKTITVLSVLCAP